MSPNPRNLRLKLCRWGNGWTYEWFGDDHVVVVQGRAEGTAAAAERHLERVGEADGMEMGG